MNGHKIYMQATYIGCDHLLKLHTNVDYRYASASKKAYMSVFVCSKDMIYTFQPAITRGNWTTNHFLHIPSRFLIPPRHPLHHIPISKSSICSISLLTILLVLSWKIYKWLCPFYYSSNYYSNKSHNNLCMYRYVNVYIMI